MAVKVNLEPAAVGATDDPDSGLKRSLKPLLEIHNVNVARWTATRPQRARRRCSAPGQLFSRSNRQPVAHDLVAHEPPPLRRGL
jgi:hypothetical protein